MYAKAMQLLNVIRGAHLLVIEVHCVSTTSGIGLLDRAAIGSHERSGGVLPPRSIAPQNQAVVCTAIAGGHLLLHRVYISACEHNPLHFSRYHC